MTETESAQRMRASAADLEFEEAARLRDEVKRLRQTELAVANDPLARQSEVERSAAAIRSVLRQVLDSEPRLTVDYADVVDAETFQPIEYLAGRIVVPVAGRLGKTRLIDNLSLDLGSTNS